MRLHLIAPAAILAVCAGLAQAADEPVAVADFAKLPANTWTLIHTEGNEGGKAFARLVNAESTDRLYLWGTGGKKPVRNLYLRYELESFSPTAPGWLAAFPAAVKGKWTAEKFPPFRIYGYGGPDGLKPTEGPRLRTVGGSGAVNRVRWNDLDGVKRPSPIHTFNQACWDSKRKRIVYFADDKTFALDPDTNTWTDLKPANHPACCRTLTWASLCYDPVNDEVLLFGGGLATNREGGARTWLYDCAANAWRRPKLDVEPPLRCNAPIVYDAASKAMVMFGGYDQAAALSDTWVYHCKDRRWEKRAPSPSPPPMFAPATAAIPGGGKILVVGYNALTGKRTHSQTRAPKETWVYDVAKDTWAPAGADLLLLRYPWLTAAGSRTHGVVFLVAIGPQRRTYAFRYDAAGPAARRKGAPPGTVAWKFPRQRKSLAAAAPPDRQAHARFLRDLPANRFVDAKPPGTLISKTWSSAVIDTDRGEVIYHGGGHSGYTGNDVARYRIADNRWSLDFPPRFPPFLESTNSAVFGWTYGCIPFSQHTYLWYTYDPASKAVLYLARPTLTDGLEVRLTDDPKDTFVYRARKHGHWSWVYDPAAKTMRPPSFGRRFRNPWHLAVVGTPKGVYAMAGGKLYRAAVDRRTGAVKWALADGSFPAAREKVKYNYEFQPLLYDSKRDRLILLKGDKSTVHVFARPLAKNGRWKQLETTGAAAIAREAVYIATHDTVVWLGRKRLFTLDCAANRLAELDVPMPKGAYGTEHAMVYAPAHDVCVALIPGSFSGPMQTFLFRFDPKGARYKSPSAAP